MSIFKEGTPSPATPEVEVQNQVPQEAEQPHNEFTDLLGTVVNADGVPKYKTVPDAIKGLAHSQAYISQLEADKAAATARLAELEQEITKRSSVEEALSQLKTPKDDGDTSQKGLGEVDIDERIAQILEQREQANVSSTNTKRVVETMKASFGDKAEEMFYSKAKELGLTPEALNNLAAQSPKAVLTMFGVNQAQPQTPKPSVGSYQLNTAPQETKLPTMIENGTERLNLPPSEKSILLGATTKDVAEEMRRHRDAVYSKYGIKY